VAEAELLREERAMTKDEQIQKMIAHNLKTAERDLDVTFDDQQFFVIAYAISLSLAIERGIMYWDDDRQACIKCAEAGIPKIIIH
jgi:hypothetical protein